MPEAAARVPFRAEVVHAVSAEDALSFIAAPYVIVLAGHGKLPRDFHSILRARFRTGHVPPVRLGVVDTSKVKWTPFRKLWVKAALSNLDMVPLTSGAPPPGYYLFVDGRPVNFGRISIDLEKDSTDLWAGGIASLLGFVTESPRIVDIGTDVLTSGGASRLAETFEVVIQLKELSRRLAAEAAAKTSLVTEERRRALRLLGINEDAGPEEIRSAHKREALKCHPDRHMQTAGGQEEATRRMAELNAARDLLLKRDAPG